MYRTLYSLIILIVAALLATTSMALNIDIGKIIDIGQKAITATTAVPVEKEVEIGRGMAASLLGASPLLADDNLERYVNHVGEWLAAQTERPELTWHFGILDDNTVNAFAAPGGYVFVTKGLMQDMHSESELAGVLAHEIGHVLRRHHLEAIRNEAMRGIAADLISEAARQHGFNAAPFINIGKELYARGLDREDEYEADRIGVVIATRAGYEPYGLPRVLLTLNDMNPSGANMQFMTSTHPPLSERLLRLDQLMKGKFDDYSQQPQITERFSEYVHGTGTVSVTEENSNKKSGAASPDKASKEETNSDKVVSGKQSEKVALAAAPEALVEKTTAEDRPALEIGHSCTFTLEYKDEGSGGNRDISIYDPKLENGFRSIGSYAQGNYNSPKGCITVVKALVDKLHNGKPPLMDPAGYDLIWKDENSGANMDGSIWQPRAPDNDYVCLGSVGQTGYAQPHISGYACVHKCLARRIRPRSDRCSSRPVAWPESATFPTNSSLCSVLRGTTAPHRRLRQSA